jgi:hypothetical protein
MLVWGVSAWGASVFAHAGFAGALAEEALASQSGIAAAILATMRREGAIRV